MSVEGLEDLLAEVRACTLCEGELEHGVRPVVQASAEASVLVAGQAPGRRVHASGVPFDDPSGERLREWMGVTREEFYDPARIAILPMGFCYPGTGRSGDLPPRPECAEAWRSRLLGRLPGLRLSLLIGKHAMDWHLGTRRQTLTETVRQWRVQGPACLPLPHPSPRNNRWLTRNPWFGEQVLPVLRARVRAALRGSADPSRDSG